VAGEDKMDKPPASSNDSDNYENELMSIFDMEPDI